MNRNTGILTLIGIMAFVGFTGSALNTDRRKIHVNSKVLHLKIEECASTIEGSLMPDGFDLAGYLSQHEVELKKINGHVPQIFAAIDAEGTMAPLDSTIMEYGDFVLINLTPTSYQLRYVGPDSLTYLASQ